MKPVAVIAFGIFATVIAALLAAARRLAARAEEERADNLLRAEIDALDKEL